MRFLPLIPSAHPSAWTTEPDEVGREDIANQVFDRDSHACRFCGHCTIGWQEVFHLDGDHENWTVDNLVTACTLCHAAQHLGRVTVGQELTLIWLPDVSQAALNCIVRRIHLTLYANGEPAHMAEPPRSEERRVHAAIRAYQGLATEAAALEGRIHTSNPRHLGAALLDLAGADRERLLSAMGGIRLLHRGRYLHQGRDIYPEILSAWSSAAPRAVTAAG
jgi:intracellular multiplication protein IcmJ